MNTGHQHTREDSGPILKAQASRPPGLHFLFLGGEALNKSGTPVSVAWIGGWNLDFTTPTAPKSETDATACSGSPLHAPSCPRIRI